MKLLPAGLTRTRPPAGAGLRRGPRSPARDAPAGRPREATAARRWARWGAVLGVLVALLAFAPAAWLASAVQTASRGQVLLADAQGSVWQGNAVLVLASGPGGRDAQALPGRLAWTLQPRLAPLALRLSLQQDCCLPTGAVVTLRPGWGQLQVTVAAAQAGHDRSGDAATPLARWPAAWLAGLGTPWNTLQPGGAVHLSAQDLALTWAQGRFVMAGSATLELRDFSSRLSTLPRLGSYRLQVSADPARSGTAQVRLETLDGALQLQGEGSWSASGLRLRGEARAAPDAGGALDNLLNIIGRRDGARSLLSIG
jgi:general secretion pathway protein N